MSTARSLPRGHAWLRALVLLLAVCTPAVPAAMHMTPVVMAHEIVEHDVIDAAVRPVTADRARHAQHPDAVPPRPAPRPRTTTAPPVEPIPHTPHTPPARRSVVLRC